MPVVLLRVGIQCERIPTAAEPSAHNDAARERAELVSPGYGGHLKGVEGLFKARLFLWDEGVYWVPKHVVQTARLSQTPLVGAGRARDGVLLRVESTRGKKRACVWALLQDFLPPQQTFMFAMSKARCYVLCASKRMLSSTHRAGLCGTEHQG